MCYPQPVNNFFLRGFRRFHSIGSSATKGRSDPNLRDRQDQGDLEMSGRGPAMQGRASVRTGGEGRLGDQPEFRGGMPVGAKRKPSFGKVEGW